MLKTWKQTGFKNHTVSEYYKVQTSLEVHMNTMIWKLSIKTTSDDLPLDLSSLWRGHFNLNRKNPKLDQRHSSFPAQPTLSITHDSEREQWHRSLPKVNYSPVGSECPCAHGGMWETLTALTKSTAHPLLSPSSTGRDTSTQKPKTQLVFTVLTPLEWGVGEKTQESFIFLI